MAQRRQIRRRGRRSQYRVRRTLSSSAAGVRAESKRSMGGDGGLMIGGVHDPAEKQADRMADQVMRMPSPGPMVHRKCESCEGEEKEKKVSRMTAGSEEEETVQAKAASGPAIAPGAGAAPASPGATGAIKSMGSGKPLAKADRAFFEPRFGADLSGVRVHDGPAADKASQGINARAFTHGKDVAFAKGEYQPGTSGGRHLLAHELAHVVGEEQIVRKQPKKPPAQPPSDPNLKELSKSEWSTVDKWQSSGAVGSQALTANPDDNAKLVANEILCERAKNDPVDIYWQFECRDMKNSWVVDAVKTLVKEVTKKGGIINWTDVSEDDRKIYVMDRLISVHGYSLNGAAGLVGNMWSESALLPNRVQGSSKAEPMNAPDFDNKFTDFTASQVANRNPGKKEGPIKPAVGIAQWDMASRRKALYAFKKIGPLILFNMDAQIDFAVQELQSKIPHLDRTLRKSSTSLNNASDRVLFEFEVPARIHDSAGNILPRNDPAVQPVKQERRNASMGVLNTYKARPKSTP